MNNEPKVCDASDLVPESCKASLEYNLAIIDFMAKMQELDRAGADAVALFDVKITPEQATKLRDELRRRLSDIYEKTNKLTDAIQQVAMAMTTEFKL